MIRHLAAFVLILSLAGALPGQAPGWNPWAGGVIYPPQQPGIQYLGQLPNGIHVFNPWNMYQNLNNQQPVYYYPPAMYYYNPYYLYNPFNPYSPYSNGYGSFTQPFVQREAGRFIPVARDLAVNPITGTQLAPYRGVAVTTEGAFYRAPGSGSFTANGAFIPGSGVYVNPITGTVYQPGSGLILRR